MADVTIFHNPKCSKSRGTLEILKDKGVDHDVVEYLATPPSREQLEGILSRLEEPPSELVRKDKRFQELGLDAGDYETADAVVGLLLEHPELMQRPIVIKGDRAVIGRPPENVLALL
jgi:arsenate reductase